MRYFAGSSLIIEVAVYAVGSGWILPFCIIKAYRIRCDIAVDAMFSYFLSGNIIQIAAVKSKPVCDLP